MAIPQWLTVVSHSLRINSFNAPRLLHTLLLGLLLFTSIGLSAINQAFADNRLIILVRHAEKADAPAGDPTLSDDGHARALALVSALQRTQISQLIATQYQRTQQTLLPMSAERHLPITVVAAEKPLEAHIQQIVEQVHAVKGNSLVAGHSNTVPLIIKALGGPEIPTIAEDDYSQLFLLSIHDGQPASLISTRYGHE
ncbi:histidine phosphatase family protein [Shewanella seohaensis]|uniref:histidine phosphatase family protein n=1 Tax=Shewanella seohaensis TaxID=755175 RepID=UPI0035BB957D